ncbi:uncharacterized protein LOC135143642 [Zophobas morio]|uniref:uncharacterized protein LOC135143642 n=1 Tax=Zophobas morio TaxID=2755281 RepID=UPI0030834087
MNSGKRALKVNILQASNLSKRDIFGSLNAYCRVYINNSEFLLTTAVKKKTKCPYWGEELFLLVAEKFDTLHFKIYNYNRFTKDGLLGSVTVNLNSVNIPEPSETSKLFSFPIQQYSKSSKVRGCLILKFQFIAPSNGVENFLPANSDSNLQPLRSAICPAGPSKRIYSTTDLVARDFGSYAEDETLSEGRGAQLDQNGIYFVESVSKSTSWARPTPKTELKNKQKLCDKKRQSQQFVRRTSFTSSRESTNSLADCESFCQADSFCWEMLTTNNKEISLVQLNKKATGRVSKLRVHSETLHHNSHVTSGDLPPGWEERRTREGRVFFVNHIEKITQWEDPRQQKSPVYIPVYARDYKTKLSYFYSHLRRKEGKIELHVSRDNIFEASYRQVKRIPHDQLNKRLCVHFKGESGLDYGGITREWFFLLSREIFSPYYGLFEYAAYDMCTLQINPHSGINPEHLKYFEFIGRIVGLAVCNQNIIDAFFIPPFYRKILNKPIEFDHIEMVDAEYYRSLLWILNNDVTDKLFLNFTVTSNKFGLTYEEELKPNGANIPVTEENKREYVLLLVEHRYSKIIKDQMEAFNRGFFSVIPSALVQIFDEKELEFLIGGLAEIDIVDWKMNTEYRNGYYSSHPVIKMFWKVVEEFDNELRARLLQFVTGTSRVPIKGFKDLHGSNGHQRFCIEKVNSSSRLCKAHTCFNRLDLPEYESADVLKERLIYVLENTREFYCE